MRKACWAGKWHRPSGKQPVGVEHGHRMAALVERMLVLHKQLAKAKTLRLRMPAAKSADGQGVAPAADRCYGPADRWVGGTSLYGLTEEEIGIVEEGV